MSWNIYFQVIFLSSELIFPFVRSKVREEVSVKVKELFGLEIGDFFHVSVSVRFKRIDGIWLDDTVKMFFDTGASISLLPKSMLDDLKVDKWVEHKMRGVIKKEECKISLKLCRVIARLEDDFGNRSPEFEVWVGIADTEEVPALLGMKDIINSFKAEMDPLKERLTLKYIKEGL